MAQLVFLFSMRVFFAFHLLFAFSHDDVTLRFQLPGGERGSPAERSAATVRRLAGMTPAAARPQRGPGPLEARFEDVAEAPPSARRAPRTASAAIRTRLRRGDAMASAAEAEHGARVPPPHSPHDPPLQRVSGFLQQERATPLQSSGSG